MARSSRARERSARPSVRSRWISSSFLDRVNDAKGCPHRPFGVIFVSHGSAEGGNDGVPDEFFHGAASPYELSSDARVVRPQSGSDVLGVGPIRSRGKPHEVDKQNRYDLPLFVQLREGRAGGFFGLPRREARPATVAVRFDHLGGRKDAVGSYCVTPLRRMNFAPRRTASR
jgi:hypothetical protein